MARPHPQTVILMAASAAIFLLTMAGELLESSIFELMVLAGWVGLFVFVEVMVIALARRLGLAAGFVDYLYAGALALNLLSLDFFFRQFLPGQILFTVPLKFGVAALFSLVFLGFFKAARDDQAKSFLYGLTGVFLIASLATTVFIVWDGMDEQDVAQHAGLPTNIRHVEFSSHPNVYVIGLDSSVPETIAVDWMGLDHVPYWDYAKESGFFLFKNSFADRVPTRNFWNSFLALDPGYFDDAGPDKYKFFSGLKESPLLSQFRHNGYYAKAIADNSSFGVVKGPYIDEYAKMNQERHILSFCSLFGTWQNYAAFFGLCAVAKNFDNTRAMGVKQHEESRANFITYILEEFEASLQMQRPVINYTHLFLPGHMPHDGTRSTVNEKAAKVFLDRYTERSLEATKVMKRIMAFIDKNDPDAIVMFLGDHGSYMGPAVTGKSDNRSFLIDWFAAFSAVRTNGVCDTWFQKVNQQAFVTQAKVMRTIVQCLAKGEDPVIGALDYRLVLDRPTSSITERYENLVYE